MDGVEKYEIKVYELNNDEYSFVKFLSKDELENFDTRCAWLFVYIVLINSIYYSNKEAFSIEEPNGSKSNVALGSNTPVAPGRPYLVQINPTAAEEIGPSSYDITVVRECYL